MYRGFWYVRGSGPGGVYHSRRFVSLREAIEHALRISDVLPYVQIGGYSERAPHSWESLGGVIDIGFRGDDGAADDEEA